METQVTTLERSVRDYLTGVWGRVLSKDPDPNDDFFDLGGDSMRAVRMILEVQASYDVELDVEQFFRSPNIASLATMIALARAPGS